MAHRPGQRQKKAGKRRLRGNNLVAPTIILIAAIVAVVPLFISGPSCGADLYFHVVSWIDAQSSLLHGHPYPNWASSPDFGAGEPRFVFYPPLSWMAGALFGLVLPWSGVLLFLDVLLLAATGLATRVLAREILDDNAATFAGCASIFLGCGIFNIYQRCNYAELSGGFWIPLMLLFQLRRHSPDGQFWKLVREGSTLPLAFVIAGIWLSDGPLGIMALYLLITIALVSTVIEKSWEPVVRATVASILGLGLSSFYLVPAIWERKWANIQDAITQREYLIENNWLFWRTADPMSPRHIAMLQLVSEGALLMFAVTLCAVLVAWRRGVLQDKRWWIPLVLIPAVVLIFLLPISLPLWHWLPALRFLQYPWRLLLLMQSSMAIFLASAVWSFSLRSRKWIVCATTIVFLAVAVGAWGILYKDCQTVLAALPGLAEQGQIWGKPEYSPPGIPSTMAGPGASFNCLVAGTEENSSRAPDAGSPVHIQSQGKCEGDFHQVANLQERKGFTGSASHAGYLILRLRSYPNWVVTLNGQSVPQMMESTTGLVAVPVAQGPVAVLVNWKTSADVIAGRCLSVVAALLLVAFYRFEWKSPAASASTENR